MGGRGAEREEELSAEEGGGGVEFQDAVDAGLDSGGEWSERTWTRGGNVDEESRSD